MSQNILAVDIGSTKVCVVIAQKDENSEVSILGIGIKKSQGLKKGVITNIDLAAKSIKSAYDTATRVAGTSPQKAYVSISGAYIKSINSSGIINIPNKEISIEEINRVLQTALYNANIPHEYEVIHILPYKFKVDEQDFIEDPLGMNANRLEAEVHIVTAQKSSIYNLKKAIKQAGIGIENIVLTGYASSIAVLSDDEKELGATVIDMGGSTCDLVIHYGNSIVYDDFLGVGSMHITNDLSIALHTPLSTAEEIKVYYGNLLEPSNEHIEIPVIGDENKTQQVSLEIVHNVIYARVEETLMILAKSVEKSSLKEQIGAGVVLTGGMTKMPGIREIASVIFDNMPVRVAKPKRLEGFFEELNDPAFSTVVGLVLYAAGEHTLYEIDSNKRLKIKNDYEIIKSDENHNNISNSPDIAIDKNKKPIKSTSLEDEFQSLEELIEMHSFEQKEGFFKRFFTKFTRWLTHLF